jgi:hypothetical protein
LTSIPLSNILILYPEDVNENISFIDHCMAAWLHDFMIARFHASMHPCIHAAFSLDFILINRYTEMR